MHLVRGLLKECQEPTHSLFQLLYAGVINVGDCLTAIDAQAVDAMSAAQIRSRVVGDLGTTGR
jgi:hypothetical protein